MCEHLPSKHETNLILSLSRSIVSQCVPKPFLSASGVVAFALRVRGWGLQTK